VKLLAFDTATDACTVAVWIDGGVCQRLEVGRRHAERLLVLVDEVLTEAGTPLNSMDAIAFGRGPGSFTGLRISAGVAQGLAFGTGLPVVPISSLAALAQCAPVDRALAAFDARMQQVYWAAYVRGVDGLVELSGEEMVVAPTAVPVPNTSNWVGVGNGWKAYDESLCERLGDRLAHRRPDCHPLARGIAELGAREFHAGNAVAADEALPVYIRDNVAVKSRAAKS
jgi:tRNA threonylcarbamoyladenosine biosynthesis protein TsaB